MSAVVPSAANWPSNFNWPTAEKSTAVKLLNGISTLFQAPEVTGTVTKVSEPPIGVTLIVLTLASATQISMCNFSIAVRSVEVKSVPW